VIKVSPSRPAEPVASRPSEPLGAQPARPRASQRRAPFSEPNAARVRRIRDRLRELYGIPLMKPHGDPVAELVLTVLSQSTNDRNRDVAYLSLRERFPTWAAVRDAPLADVELAIRGGGISKVKSARIQAILRAISEEGSDEVSLDHLAHIPLADARAELTALPGVGRKTAACVLLFALGRREVPVDTHVSRVATRLGMLPVGASFEELHDRMLDLTPAGQELELHVNLLRHGRRTCFARTPACSRCALARMCPSRGLWD
jgi:endonuclease-3